MSSIEIVEKKANSDNACSYIWYARCFLNYLMVLLTAALIVIDAVLPQCSSQINDVLQLSHINPDNFLPASRKKPYRATTPQHKSKLI